MKKVMDGLKMNITSLRDGIAALAASVRRLAEGTATKVAPNIPIKTKTQTHGEIIMDGFACFLSVYYGISITDWLLSQAIHAPGYLKGTLYDDFPI